MIIPYYQKQKEEREKKEIDRLRIRDQYYKNWFSHNTTAITLRLDFDPRFEFVLITLHYQFEDLIMLPLAAADKYWADIT